jgi:hypothetical protein
MDTERELDSYLLVMETEEVNAAKEKFSSASKSTTETSLCSM